LFGLQQQEQRRKDKDTQQENNSREEVISVFFYRQEADKVCNSDMKLPVFTKYQTNTLC